MNLSFALRFVALVCAVLSFTQAHAQDSPCATPACVVNDPPPSWAFRRSTFTHDPYTGARVAQYMRTPPVEPLDDERMVTSRYKRSRTNLRGIDGSIDTYYEVQAWGNGRGGIDAEWERFHDAWKESYLTGGFYNQGPGSGHWGQTPGWGGGVPGFGFPGQFFAPGFNFSPGFGFPPQGGWQGNWGQGGWPHGGRHGGGRNW